MEVEYFPGTSTGEKTAWIVSFTGVSNEPRVIRQAEALLSSGWRVLVMGYEGHTQRNPEWHFAKLPSKTDYTPFERILLRLQRVSTRYLCSIPLGKYWRRKLAYLHHRSIPEWRIYTRQSLEFAKLNPGLRADLVLGHDFHSCEVSYGLARHFDAKFSVDCHEYARGQYAHDPAWVKYTKPYICGMHDYYLTKAEGITTVCDGIAELLNNEESLKQPVSVVRSVSFYNAQQYRPVGDRIKVLYHGDVSYIRGLHKAIKSMPLWREEFDLIIRGNGDPDYLKYLTGLAADLGLKDRITIEPPVSFDQIIPRANEADIGYFVHKDVSPQKRFVLPNKFFEYVMAGLAICVSDLPEMAHLTNKFDMGKLVHNYSEEDIADAINSFDRDKINQCKLNALTAAEELNWDREKQQMLTLYNNLTND